MNKKKTNLLYVFADQWRAQGVGYRFEDAVLTPNIDRFAKESVVFDHGISTFPLCSPHRASLMTGKYPLNAGMWTNCKTGLEDILMLKPQETCIGNVLKENGYRTGYIGKWHLDASEMNFSDHPSSGACDWDAYTPPGERRQGFDYWLSYGADDNHLTPHYWEDTNKMINVNKWSAEYETDKALEFLENSTNSKTECINENPFALFISYNPPHLPYELVPQKYMDMYESSSIEFRANVPKEKQNKELERITKQYFAAITGVDEQFARILTFLKENDLEENTLVVLSSDHGDMLGSHGRMSKNIWYQESIHIPLMIRKKGEFLPNNSDVIFASPDHMPTILSLLSLPIPDTCQGYSHMRSMFATDNDAPTHAFICSIPGMPSMVNTFTKRGLNHKSYGWRGVYTKKYTYVVNNGYEPNSITQVLLYNNIDDPFQLHPITITKSEDLPVAKELHCILLDYLEKTGDCFLV